MVKIEESKTNKIDSLVMDLQAQGKQIIKLNVGESDFDTPQIIKDACIKAISENKTRYAKVSGIDELKKAICKKLEKDNNLKYSEENIVVSTGAKQSVFNAVFATCSAKDEVIIPTPCWVSYSQMVKLAGAKPVFVKTKDNFSLDIEAIKKAVTVKTKAIIINTPNNPSGAVYSKSSLKQLTDLALEKDFYIISDEVYEKLVYGKKTHISPAAISQKAKKKCIVINGFSKAYAMTGFRLGYCACDKEIAKNIIAIQSHITGNSTTFVQWAGVSALNCSQSAVKKMVLEYEKRRDFVYERLSAISGIKCIKPQGAFYFLPDISAFFSDKIKDSNDFCAYLIAKAGVALVPGDAFNAPNCVRISYALSMKDLAKAMDAIREALENLDQNHQNSARSI